MAEEGQVQTPYLPPDYVSIAVLRERWMQRQKAKKEEEARRKEMNCAEDSLNDGDDDVGDGKGNKVVEEVEKRGRLYGSGGNTYCNPYRDDEGMRMNVGGGGLRGFRDRRISNGGDRRRFGGRWERIELDVRGGNGEGNVVSEGECGGGDRRRFGRGFGVGKGESEVEDGDVVEGLKGSGNRWIYEGEGTGEDRRRFGRGLGGRNGETEVEKGNVVEGFKGSGNRWIYEGEDVGGDDRGFGKGFGAGKRENEVKKRKVVEREEDVVLEGSKGYGNRRINDAVDIAGILRDLEISCGGSSEPRGFGKGENGDVRRYVVDVRDGIVVDVKLLEDFGETQVNEEVEIGGRFRGLSRNGRRSSGKYGRDRRKFGKVLGVGKGENVVEKKRNVADVRAGSEVVKGNVVDVREDNVVDGTMLELSEGGDRKINEAVDIGRKLGDLKINGGGKRGKFRYGGKKISVAARKENEAEMPISVAAKKENEVEKPIAVAVRKENEVVKQNLVDVKGKNDVEKQIPVAVRDENEVQKRNLVDVRMAESSKGFGHRRGNDAVRRENEVEKRNLVDVKETNDIEKQIPVAVRDGNEVKKQNLVDLKTAESSNGFSHRWGNEAIGEKFGGFGQRRGNAAIGGNFGDLSNNGWRKGNVKYGSGRERLGSWKNKHEESGMMWVKKADAEADTQAQVETSDVK
ncbi:hypothetical protein POM88_005820 [Heracleum sosnowskyi]|uniref:Uncharacterized protein n=1 Tax=Heracleum sosnowskyi TaxID=360622 RepID=A0AAD8N4Q2_9APIA|nr:hypothetical protein POM88_005820 [Heracleum sosnowskyi]